MKSMAIKKKLMSMDESIVMNKGFSNKGLSEKPEYEEEESEGKEYPYCLRIYLGPEELEMIGMKELPKLGSKLPMQAIAKVMGLRQNEEGNSLDLQIIAMELGQSKDKKSTEEMLYSESESESEE